MSRIDDTLQRISAHPMRAVRRYIWAALFGGFAIWWYAYTELSLNASEQFTTPILYTEIWGKSITAGITFGVFFGFIVLLAAELPERLRGFWRWWQCLLLSLVFGFIGGALYWLAYDMLLLYNGAHEMSEMGGIWIGAFAIAIAFALRAAFRIPALLALPWAAVVIYLSLYLTWVNNSPPIIYTSLLRDEHINQYAPLIAFLFALGAYFEQIFTDVLSIRQVRQQSLAPS